MTSLIFLPNGRKLAWNDFAVAWNANNRTLNEIQDYLLRHDGEWTDLVFLSSLDRCIKEFEVMTALLKRLRESCE